MIARHSCLLSLVLASLAVANPIEEPAALKLGQLRNPVWTSGDNLRDPSVLKTRDGYRIFYSRFTGGAWNKKENWAVASVLTSDFVTFEDDHDVSPKGFASPGDVISWHGRWLLPYQSYPVSPSKLCFSESKDLGDWSAPRFFLEEAAALPWNTGRRVIDPSFVVDGDTLHCYFIGTGYREANGQENPWQPHGPCDYPRSQA